MPVYATLADVEARIGADRLNEIADHNADGSVDEEMVEAVIEDVSSIADSYLTNEQVPTPPPRALVSAVVDIAVHRMRDRRDRGTDASMHAHDMAIKWLERIAKGEVTLTPATPGIVDAGDARIESREREWDRDIAKRVL